MLTPRAPPSVSEPPVRVPSRERIGRSPFTRWKRGVSSTCASIRRCPRDARYRTTSSIRSRGACYRSGDLLLESHSSREGSPHGSCRLFSLRGRVFRRHELAQARQQLALFLQVV